MGSCCSRNNNAPIGAKANGGSGEARSGNELRAGLPEEDLFEACNTDATGGLAGAEVKFFMNGLCLYPSAEELGARQRALALGPELQLPDLRRLARDLREAGVGGGRAAVPHARRGVTLEQLTDIQAAYICSGWLPGICEKHNADKRDDIACGKAYPMAPNLYALDTMVVRQVTRPETAERAGIPARHILCARTPPPPARPCSYSELYSPRGLRIDAFVSHFWGHEFERTVMSLEKYAQAHHTFLGKASPVAAVFWICLFAVSQHDVANEVGSTPESGPFNAAISHARDVVMVLDERTRPFLRIWCLYEVHRAAELNHRVHLLAEQGSVEESGMLRTIAASLEQICAFDAQASVEADKHAIWYRIQDNDEFSFGQPDLFKQRLQGKQQATVKKVTFAQFDTRVGQILATPVLHASIAEKDCALALRQIGLGAELSAENLQKLVDLGADFAGEVPTKFGFGSTSMAHIAAFFGNVPLLQHVLAASANVAARTRDGRTPLHSGAHQGNKLAVRELLAARADTEAADKDGWTPLHLAALQGEEKNPQVVVQELVAARANVDVQDRIGYTPLHSAAQQGHLDFVQELLAAKADLGVVSRNAYTPLHIAASHGHEAVAQTLLAARADLTAKAGHGETARDIAQQKGHESLIRLLEGLRPPLNAPDSP